MGFVDKSNTFVGYVSIAGKIKEGFRHASSSSVPECNRSENKTEVSS